MFGDLKYILVIIALVYFLYCANIKNSVLACEIEHYKNHNSSGFEGKPKEKQKLDANSKKLYEKINDVVNKNLGISLRDFVLGES